MIQKHALIKKIITRKRNGSVLLFSIMILALVAVTIERLLRTRMIGSSFAHQVIQQEQAKLLALSGIQYALALVAYDKDKKESEGVKTQKEEAKEKEESPEQRYLKKIVPLLNRWHEVSFSTKAESEGSVDQLSEFSGTFKLCLVAEQGKININEAFDFKKGEFKKEYQQLLQQLALTGLPEGAVLERLTDYLKKRGRKLDDIAELRDVQGLETITLFYEPPAITTEEKKSKSNEHLALTDLFTIWSPGEALCPLFFSDSVCALFSLQRPRADDQVTMKEQFEAVIAGWRSTQSPGWKFLEPIYGELPDYFESFNRLFSKEFGTPVYSVVSCGKVGNVEQRVLAIIGLDKQRKEREKEPATQTAGEKKKKRSIDYFKILKAYWQ